MSTDLITYLNYMATWDEESDENINHIIDEHNLFLKVDNFQYEGSIDAEFKTVVDLAKQIRDITIEEDAAKIVADAAAVGAIWSFGLSMAVFAAAQANVIIDQKIISKKSKALNEKLDALDTNISSRINQDVSKYVALFKSNNNLIAAKAPAGLDTQKSRADLFQFMGELDRKGVTLNPENFRKYARSCRKLFDSDEINDVYDALDDLNLSKRTDKDVKEFMNTLVGFKVPGGAELAVKLTQAASILIMVKAGIPKPQIQAQGEIAEMEAAEISEGAFMKMNAFGKFFGVLIIVTSVVDALFDILDIIHVVEQCKKMVDSLEGPIKAQYMDYFKGIQDASRDYKKAIAQKS